MKLIRIGLVALALVVVVLAVIASRMDSMIKAEMETIGPQATRSSVKLDSVRVSLLSGRCRIRGLVIGNPNGFRTENALKLADMHVHLNVGSIFSDRIVIDQIVIDGPEVTYERGPSGSNIDKIQKNVESYARFSSHAKPSHHEDKAAAQKKFQINRLSVKNGRVLMSTGFMAGKTVAVSLPDIELKDIGNNSTGATMQEVSAKVLAAIESDVSQAVASAGSNLAPALENAEGTAKEAGGQAKKAVSGAIKNVRGMFGK